MPTLTDPDAPGPLIVPVTLTRHPPPPAPVATQSTAGEGGFDLGAFVKQQNAAAPATPQPGSGPSPPPPPARAREAKDFDLGQFVRQQGQAATEAEPSAEERLRRLGRVLMGRDADVDYSTGAPWNVRLALARSDNPDEAAAMLERRVGKGNYGQDSHGDWWVMQDGRKVAVRPSGGIGFKDPGNGFLTNITTAPAAVIEGVYEGSPALQNMAVDMLASAPGAVGTIGGAAAGGLAAGPPGAAIGAALGYMGGKGADETEKAAEGGLKKTAAGEAGELSRGAAVNMALEGAAPAVARGAKSLLNRGAEWLGETTPETRGTTSRLLQGGATPPMVSVAPGLKPTQYRQKMRNLIMGDPYEKANTEYSVRRAEQLLEDAGKLPEDVQEMMGEITSQDARMSGTSVGQSMNEEAQRRYGGLRAEAETATAAAQVNLDRFERELHAYADSQDSRLGDDVSRAIKGERTRFGQQMSAAYKAVDDMAGEEPVIPVSYYKNEAKLVMGMLSDTEKAALNGAEKKAVEDLLQAPDDLKLTFQQAHDFRSIMREQSRRAHTDLTPGMRAHILGGRAARAHEALTEGLADAGDAINFAAQGEFAGLPKSIVDELRRVDDVYRDGIAKFHNARMRQLVREARDGIFPDPNEIARAILAPGHLEQTRTILAMLPQDVRDQVAKADAFNIIQWASDPQTGVMDGGKLRAILRNPSRAAVMDLVYPPQTLQRIRQYADELAALHGKLDTRFIKSFSSRDMEEALQTSISRARDIDSLVQTNIGKALVSPDSQVVDDAADKLLSGGNENELLSARKFFGESSPQWKALQDYALKKVLYRAVVETPTLARSVEGKAIDDAMKQWTTKEQDILFPNGLRDDVRLLAKDMKFLHPPGMNDAGSSIAAAAIKSKFPFHLRAWLAYIDYGLLGWLSAHPVVLRFLAQAERSDPGVARRALPRLAQWWVNTQMTGPANQQMSW